MLVPLIIHGTKKFSSPAIFSCLDHHFFHGLPKSSQHVCVCSIKSYVLFRTFFMDNQGHHSTILFEIMKKLPESFGRLGNIKIGSEGRMISTRLKNSIKKDDRIKQIMVNNRFTLSSLSSLVKVSSNAMSFLHVRKS